MFPPTLPLHGQFLLITDELSSPADFLLHQSLGLHLKEKKKAVVLSVSEDFARWKALAAKSNLNLPSEYLSFVDVMQTAGPSNVLRPVYDNIVKAALDEDTLVMMDDISTLEWVGFTSLELSRFARALRILCFQKNAALVIRHHIVTPDEPDALFRDLLQLCTYHMDVRPLASGKSGAVSGEIALHAGPSTSNPQIALVNRSSAVQYRLTDVGSVFFERGTGGGVL